MFRSYDWENKLKSIYQSRIFVILVSTLFLVLLFFYDYDKYIYTSGYTILGKNAIVQIYNNLFRFVIGMVGSISIMQLVCALVNKLPSRLTHLLEYIGRNTMGIYIISGYLFTEILCFVSLRFAGFNCFCLFIETICIAAISVFVTAILKKNTLTNKLFLGGR
jgi:surface polysaccharide O-acyltransferase-like enzyme